jgi:8-oxo-dGTP diphosphatase
MMHRIKKENDINRDKWVGIGGHFEKDESPEECLLREAKEETYNGPMNSDHFLKI